MPCCSRNGFIKTSIRWPDVRAHRAAEETMRVLCPAPAHFFPLLPAQCLCSMWSEIVVFLLPHLSMSTNSLASLCSVISKIPFLPSVSLLFALWLEKARRRVILFGLGLGG